MAEEATYVLRPVRIKHENSEPRSGGGSGTKDLIFGIGALAVGAIGAYYVTDYIVKSKVLDSIFAGLPEANGDIVDDKDDVEDKEEEEDEEEKKANVAQITPLFGYEYANPRAEFDRTTRVNSYAARKFGEKEKSVVIEGGVEVPVDASDVLTEGQFNQIVTDDAVYNYT